MFHSKNSFLNISLFIIVILVFNVISVNSQIDYKNYDWVKNPKLLEVPAEHKDASELVLKEHSIVGLEFASDKELYEYFIEHTITHINSDEAIENNNKVFLPFRSASTNVLKQKARVITPKGEIIEMQDGDIKEAKIEQGTYRYFALRGLVKGSQVETFFVLKKDRPDINGEMIIVQSEVPKYNVSFDLYAPDNLTFISKPYNGLEALEEVEIKEEEGKEGVFHLSQKWDFIEPLKEEGNAFYSPNLKKFIYRIDKNKMRPNEDIVSYDIIAKNLHEVFEIVPDKKLSKKLKPLLEEAGVRKLKTEEEKLFALENYLKRNYGINERGGETDLEAILANKSGSKDGIMRLYCAILNAMGIEHEIVFNNSRDKHKFDEEIEAFMFLENYLLYFPNIDKFMAPTEIISKLGYIPALWTNNYAMFVKELKIGDFKTVEAKIDFIEALDYTFNVDKMFVDVKTEDGFKTISVDYKKEATGEFVRNIQPIYDFVDESIVKEINESQIKFLTEDLDILEMNVENATFKDFGMKPYKFNCKFTTKAFMQRAGNKLLFKVGELIGPQVEMYQEEERKLPVDGIFNRQFYRELSLEIPEGFEVGNLEALKINETYEAEGEIQAQFVSDYTFENNVVKVIIDEYYNRVNWPVDLFEDYKRVINAAADFNKVVLYIEK